MEMIAKKLTTLLWILLSLECSSALITNTGMSLTSTNNSPTVDSSVTLTCQTPGYDEITWSGPNGVSIIFAPNCFRLSEAESTHITYISVSCGGGSSVLTINNFDPARDAGGWSCTGYSFMGWSDSASITLTAPASNVENIKIRTELAFIDHYDRISLLYGEKETIHCSADCQNGCQFTWHLENQLVSSSNELVIDLQSSPATPGGRYMCTASSGGDKIRKNVTIERQPRNTIIFSPPDDILNVNEGDNVSIICDGTANGFYCSSGMMFECYTSWNTMSDGFMSTPHELNFYNITPDKAGRHYCIHNEYEKSSNTQVTLYRSVLINVIGNSTSAAPSTATTSINQATTTTQGSSTSTASFTTTIATTTDQPTTTTQESSTSTASSTTTTIATTTDHLTTTTQGMVLTSTNNSPTAGSSVTLTCQTLGFDEIIWRGPSGVYILFAGCLRISEAETTHITYISVSCGGGSSVLTINNFDPARDAGDWSCTIDSFMLTSDSASISLTAAASNVENIKITTELAFIDHYDTISLLYGEKETIHCSADCQNACQFTWHLENQLVSSSNELVIDLQSSPATPGGRYMCTASSGGDSVTKNVTLKRLKRGTIIFSPPDDILNVNAGDNVSITCSGMDTYHCSVSMLVVCDTSWNTMSDGFVSTPRELNLNNITPDKAGRHYCIYYEYDQTANSQITLYRSVKINVIDTPSMSLTSTNNSPTVDSSVTLTCQNPGYDEITWNGPHGVFIIFGPASNVENIKITTELAFIDHYDTISLLYGEKETIHCSADCQNGCQFTWHLENQLVSSSNELVIDLQSSPATPGGRYMCTASSGGDKIRKNVTIDRHPRNTIIFSPPDDILKVNEGDNVSIVCDGMTYDSACFEIVGIECTDMWNTMSTSGDLKFYNITLDKTGKYYCYHEMYEQSSNTRYSLYRSVQINVIGSSRSTASSTTTTIATTTDQPTTTTQESSTSTASSTTTTIATTTDQPTTTTQGMVLTSTNNSPTADSSVTLTCQTPGYDEITWSGPNGVSIIFAPNCFRLSEAESTHITYISVSCGGGSSVLTINNFDPARDAGGWSCTGNSYMGSSDSASITLTAATSNVENIKITTEFAFIDHYDTISLLFGEKETIHCSADCQNGCQFTWHLENQLVSSSNKLVIDQQSSPATPGGRYMCTVSSGGDKIRRNVTINRQPRNTIIFSPPDDILNVNEGDNVSIICDGMTNDNVCSYIVGIECTDMWNTMSTSGDLKFYNITLDKTGKYYCYHEMYEQSSNTRSSFYRSIQINVIETTSMSVTVSPTSVTTSPTTVTTPLTPATTSLTFVTSSSTTVTTSPTSITASSSSVTLPTSVTESSTTVITSPTSDTASPTTVTTSPTSVKASSTTVTMSPTFVTASPTTVKESSSTVTTSPTSITTSLIASGTIRSLKVVSSSDPLLVQEGNDLTLNCQADCEPVDSCVYTWKLNGDTIANTQECEIINITRQATGTYTCSASNGQTMTEGIDVKVNYPPSAFTITRVPDKATYNVLSTIVLTCNVDSVPKSTLTWTKGSKVLQVSDTFNYLSLSNVLTGNSGEYTCTADNGIGEKMTATTSITIKYIVHGGSGASSMHWMFLQKIVMVIIIVYIVH